VSSTGKTVDGIGAVEANDGSAGNSYEKWCKNYWKGCFTCEYYITGKVKFCKKWNEEHPEEIGIVGEQNIERTS
jgi:hypothetical protein